MARQGIGKTLVAGRAALVDFGHLRGQIERCGLGRGPGVLYGRGRNRIDRENTLTTGASDFERLRHKR